MARTNRSLPSQPTTLLNLNALLRSPSPLNHNETILPIDSLIALSSHQTTYPAIHHTPAQAPLAPDEPGIPRPISITPPEPALLRPRPHTHSNPPAYTTIPSTPPSLDLDSQAQDQPQDEPEQAAPPSYPQHLTTDPPAPAYTKADQRRGRKIRFLDVLRGRRRSEKVYWVFMGVLICLALGALCFGVVEWGLERTGRGLGGR
ncbi:uncharacterized protein DSM5745_06768 [Aspergillus mulundensis]|uniref:Uncharacterized protein n=1 Tax=Aspergillus mulundensis TaxID=1810919 RepID=A0A3D8RS54_9EURO|nr:hypothetical protein DSM5745_06768 [Aspergillus mulundensis]RDW76776.1 hypothetical protein DSM5745_06768 [Aspergillus mulundensis]